MPVVHSGLNVAAEGTGTGDRTYNFGGGGPGGIVCRGDAYFYHCDRLGNVVAVSNVYGNATGFYTMDSFGNVVERAGAGGFSTTLGEFQPYHLTTKELDPDTGLYYFNARWNDCAVGRFISTASPYTLAGNNPANYYNADGSAGYDYGDRDWGEVIGAVLSEYGRFIRESVDGIQVGLDVAGTFDPTPVCDGVNAGIYGCRGRFADAGLSAAGMAPYIGDVLKWGGKAARKGGKIVCMGQWHHPISVKVARETDKYPNLAGVYRPRDPRFTTQAIDKAAHNGYDRTQRQVEAEIALWLSKHPKATMAQFEDWLIRRYSQPDLLARFPNGLL